MTTNTVSQHEILNLLNLIRPWQMVNLFKVRLGNPADGGYVLPVTAYKSNRVVSIGIGNEVSFDKVLADLNAKVIQFDHTIPGAPLVHENIDFYQKGWGPFDTDILLSLKSMMALLDWQDAVHPILKFDTEGAEWEALKHTDSADLARFEIITGEFHNFHLLSDRSFFDLVHEIFSKLAETHYCIHLHANNAGGIVLVGGIPMPRLLELSYVRKDAAAFAGHSNEPIPGPLDYPNLPGIPDIILRAF